MITLFRLNLIRNNFTLQDLDLRLNPVTKNEPDYRLFLVHMLPNLRRLGKRFNRHLEFNGLTSIGVGEGLEKRASYNVLCKSLKCSSLNYLLVIIFM